MGKLAPIILFTYNRPYHTEQTLFALSKNLLASDSILYIFSDGPKPEDPEVQKKKIAEVRKIIRKYKWCKEVIIYESDTNKGLANSIIEGVSDIITRHDQVIVLEDDLITSVYFLQFMNQALGYYENYKSVFSISADRPAYKNLIVPEDYQYDVFVALRPFSYGWATWKDRWEKIDWSTDFIPEFIACPEQVKAFNRGGDDLSKMLLSQFDGKIDSWAIRFVFAHFKNHAISILPCVSYIENIGNDGSGTHTGRYQVNAGNHFQSVPEYPRFLDVLYEDRRIINSFYSSFYPHKRPLWKKTVNRLCRLFGKRNIFLIKKKVYI